MQMKVSVAPSGQIFEVTKDPVANWEKYAVIVSHTIPFVTFN
jgi:hypothetical protein